MNKNRQSTVSHRFVHTRREDNAGEWYALDNAAIIMPAVTDDISTRLFRFEAELDAPIDPEILKKALALTVNRMPYFNVRLRRGFFWYYFEPCKTMPSIYPDLDFPCQGWNINRHGTRMFRILWKRNRISGEFSHALTDGTGGIGFFKSLLANYLILKGVDPGARLGEGEWKDIAVSSGEMSGLAISEEFEDAYQRYFPNGLPFPDLRPHAFHLSKSCLPKGQYRIISGKLLTSEVIAEAHRRNISLTELMSAVYLDALQHIWYATNPPPREPYVSVEIPINLRQLFPSRTFRNFSLFVLISEDMRLGMRDFDELVLRTHYQMKLEYDRMSISRHLCRNAGSARNLAVRLVPLRIKDFFARVFFSKFGESMLSGFISNLGQLKMPPGFVPHILSFGFIPAPSMVTMTNASMLSWGNELIINFGSLAQSRELEQLFFRRLRSIGLHVSVSCRSDNGISED
ncbi:MAG TPA: hypothetical protein PKL47_02675 [Rectinema sp.]|nr:hypothetical protein [Rectinema sp.]